MFSRIPCMCRQGVVVGCFWPGYKGSSKYQHLLPLTGRDSPEQVGVHAAITAGADNLAVNHIKKLHPPGPGERGTKTVCHGVCSPIQSTYTIHNVETFCNCACVLMKTNSCICLYCGWLCIASRHAFVQGNAVHWFAFLWKMFLPSEHAYILKLQTFQFFFIVQHLTYLQEKEP